SLSASCRMVDLLSNPANTPKRKAEVAELKLRYLMPAMVIGLPPNGATISSRFFSPPSGRHSACDSVVARATRAKVAMKSDFFICVCSVRWNVAQTWNLSFHHHAWNTVLYWLYRSNIRYFP